MAMPKMMTCASWAVMLIGATAKAAMTPIGRRNSLLRARARSRASNPRNAVSVQVCRTMRMAGRTRLVSIAIIARARGADAQSTTSEKMMIDVQATF